VFHTQVDKSTNEKEKKLGEDSKTPPVCPIIKDHFTLWPKVEKPSIFTNHMARNREFTLSTLHTRAMIGENFGHNQLRS
jgi:hypothetical protein